VTYLSFQNIEITNFCNLKMMKRITFLIHCGSETTLIIGHPSVHVTASITVLVLIYITKSSLIK
jgi:hypothetical protein